MLDLDIAEHQIGYLDPDYGVPVGPSACKRGKAEA
jgi:hypothetical protein